MRLAVAIYEANNDTPNAVKILRDAIVKNPTDVALYVDFAEIAMNHQSFQAGIEMINSGLKLQPNAAELYVARGVLYVQLADYVHAEEDFERAEQLDPSRGLSAAAQGMLAEERDQSNPDRALSTIKAKLAKNPGDPFLWYLQAAVISQKSPEPGSAEFEQGMNSAKKAVVLATFSHCGAQRVGEVLSGLWTKCVGSKGVPYCAGAEPGRSDGDLPFGGCAAEIGRPV